jgi:hypothetical protein
LCNWIQSGLLPGWRHARVQTWFSFLGGSLAKSYEINGVWLVLGRLKRQIPTYLFIGVNSHPMK